MLDLLHAILTRTEKKEDVLLISVVASSGAVPRGAGSRMLLFQDGGSFGTIGGGSVEYQALRLAAGLLREKKSMNHSYALTRNEVEDIGMICGGTVQLQFHYIAADDADTLAGIRKAREWAAQDLSFVMLESSADGLAFYRESEGIFGKMGKEAAEPVLSQLGGKSAALHGEIFAERLEGRIRTILFGGGHVSQAVAPLLLYLGFEVIVCDDREEFLRAELFPGVRQRVLVDFENIAASLEIRKGDYLCVLTRGHSFDETVEAQALKTEAAYIGAIGSSRKNAAVKQRLRERGFTDGEIARIICPIGIPIAGSTPREIGISIAAQLVDIRGGSRK